MSASKQGYSLLLGVTLTKRREGKRDGSRIAILRGREDLPRFRVEVRRMPEARLDLRRRMRRRIFCIIDGIRSIEGN